MKFDDLLAQYLYENKTLQLQGIGTLKLDNSVSIPLPQDKQIYYPIEGLHFTFNPKEQTSEELVIFLVKKLGKIIPLVRSDLESYLSNIKQFINIGKPYTIEGVGTLQINNHGTYEFSPGNFLPGKEELSPHRDNPENLHRQSLRKTETARSMSIILTIAAIVLIVAGIIWGIYFLMNRNNATLQEITADTSNTAMAPDTLATVVMKPTNLLPGSDSAYHNFKLIFDITKSRERIASRSILLTNSNFKFAIDTIQKADTPRYRMFVPRTLRFTDTTKAKDTLRIFFNRQIVLEKLP